jgi:hypothetical protein
MRSKLKLICPRPITGDYKAVVYWNDRVICTIAAAEQGPAIRIESSAIPEISYQKKTLTIKFSAEEIFRLREKGKDDGKD